MSVAGRGAVAKGNEGRAEGEAGGWLGELEGGGGRALGWYRMVLKGTGDFEVWIR